MVFLIKQNQLENLLLSSAGHFLDNLQPLVLFFYGIYERIVQFQLNNIELANSSVANLWSQIHVILSFINVRLF